METSRNCLTCHAVLPIESFTKHKQSRGGYLSHCKKCLAVKSKAYKALDPEKWRSINRVSKASDKSRLADKLRKKEAYLKDPDKYKLRCKSYYKENTDLRKASVKNYRSLNKDRYSLLGAERRSRKRTATPSWITKDQRGAILSYFKEARMRTRMAGVAYEVDHLVPLQGETVCGLHVPWNLQVLTKVENVKKSNTHWPDMWEV